LVLGRSLLDHDKTQLPSVFALMALMCFHSSRLASRLGTTGEMILLDKQDRSKWNQDMISSGIDYLLKSAFGDKLSHFHLEALIAYEHCKAKSYESTNWKEILTHYEALLSLKFDPVVYLNKAMVLLELEGPDRVLKSLDEINGDKQIQKYYLFHAVKGKILEKLDRKEGAITCLKKAAALTLSEKEKAFFLKKIEDIIEGNLD